MFNSLRKLFRLQTYDKQNRKKVQNSVEYVKTIYKNILQVNCKYSIYVKIAYLQLISSDNYFTFQDEKKIQVRSKYKEYEGNEYLKMDLITYKKGKFSKSIREQNKVNSL